VSDEIDKTEEAADNDGSDELVGGERLADARRRLQVSVAEIAKELHLDDFKVRALERNDFDVLGAPVFAKGHLKKYAQLVKVDEADVMADYYRLNRESGTVPVVPKHTRPRQRISLGPWIGALVVIALAASGYWWSTTREVSQAPPVTGAIAPLPQEANSASAAVDDAEPDDQPELVEPGVADETDPIASPETETELAPEPEPEPVLTPIVEANDSDMSLSITYSGDCWTEITDASGRRLFFDLGKTGRTVNLTGTSPFDVLFGDVANVSLVVNGSPFVVPASDRRGLTARLTITAP